MALAVICLVVEIMVALAIARDLARYAGPFENYSINIKYTHMHTDALIDMSTDERKPSLEKIKSARERSESMVDVEFCPPRPGPDK